MKQIKKIIRRVDLFIKSVLYMAFSCFPLQSKVVGSSFYGKKYENNTKYIMDALENIDPNVKKIWIKGKRYDYSVPQYIRAVTNPISQIYEYATAKVWIDTHNIPLYARRRKGQLFIFCYHAGLFQKKIAADIQKNDRAGKHNAENANIFISNSKHLDSLIRTALQFHGPIWHTGLPKNDIFFPGAGNHDTAKGKIVSYYKIADNTNIFLYAPTHRQELKKTLHDRFGGLWTILIRLHPANIHEVGDLQSFFGPEVVDADYYPDMQELILGTDVFLTDYSSTIFDAAERKIPCLTYVADYNHFTETNRELYFTLDELPFPYASNEDELFEIIRNYDDEIWLKKWDVFAKSCNLSDTNDSAQIIASFIDQYIKGDSDFEKYLPLEYEDNQ